MLCNQKRKIGVFGLLFGILVAVAVNGDDAVGVFIDDRTLRVHAERAHAVAVGFGSVYNLAFVKLVRQVRKHGGGQLHANADVDSVGLGGNVKFFAHALHPFGSASADGDDEIFALVHIVLRVNLISVLRFFYALNGGVKVELDLVL